MPDSYVTDAEAHYIKSPVGRLDYTWDWVDWLAEITDSISSVAVTVPEGLTAVGEPAVDGGFVTQRVEGGVVGATCRMVCQITTDGGLIDARLIYLTILDR